MSSRSSRFSSLGSDAIYSLEVAFLHQVIKEAVWDCRGDRARSPNGFYFAFLSVIAMFWVKMLLLLSRNSVTNQVSRLVVILPLFVLSR